MFHVSGKQYVPEEGDGTERLYRIDYGATFQGVTTALFGFFLAFCHFKVGKEPSAEKYTMLSAASAVMMLVFLQTAVRILAAQPRATLARHALLAGCTRAARGLHAPNTRAGWRAAPGAWP